MLDPEELEILRQVVSGPREFQPAEMTDAGIIAFDPIGDRILALSEAGLLRLVGAPLMNYETPRGKYGKIIAGLTPAGHRALERYEAPGAEEVAIIRRRLVESLAKRQRTFGQEFKAHEARQETFYGMDFVPGTRELIQEELHRRGELALDCWFAAAEARGKVFTPSLASLARQDVADALHAGASDLLDLFTRCTVLDQVLPEAEFDLVRDPVRSQLEAELNYAVLVGGRPSSVGIPARSPEIQDRSVTIHGHVFGSVLTGEKASATVNFQLRPEARQVFVAKLAELRGLLERDERIEASDREQLVRTVDSALAEGQTESPNRIAIGGLLYALATAVQTLGAAPTAWQLVKAAAAAFGLHVN